MANLSVGSRGGSHCLRAAASGLTKPMLNSAPRPAGHATVHCMLDCGCGERTCVQSGLAVKRLGPGAGPVQQGLVRMSTADLLCGYLGGCLVADAALQVSVEARPAALLAQLPWGEGRGAGFGGQRRRLGGRVRRALRRLRQLPRLPRRRPHVRTLGWPCINRAPSSTGPYWVCSVATRPPTRLVFATASSPLSSNWRT